MESSNAVLIGATMDMKGNKVLYLDTWFKKLGIPVLTLVGLP